MADTDPLGKWRRPGAQIPSPATESGRDNRVVDLANYQGDHGKDRSGGWLELRPVNGPWSLLLLRTTPESHLQREEPTRVDLIFTYELVTVKGRNLETLLSGLRLRTLACIEQFNPATQQSPPPDALMVESIVSSDNAPPVR